MFFFKFFPFLRFLFYFIAYAPKEDRSLARIVDWYLVLHVFVQKFFSNFINFRFRYHRYPLNRGFHGVLYAFVRFALAQLAAHVEHAVQDQQIYHVVDYFLAGPQT